MLMVLDTLVPTMATMAMPATHMLVPLLPTPTVLLSQLIPQPKLLPRLSTLLPRALPHTTMPMALLHMPMVTQLSMLQATQDWLPIPMEPLSQLNPLMLLKPVPSTWPLMHQLKRRTI